MKNKVPTIYENDEGDYWVRKDQVISVIEATKLVQSQYGDDFQFIDEEKAVELTECESGCPGTRHPGHRRGKGTYDTYHFCYVDMNIS